MREIRFFIFRHGETDWNAEGRFQGHIDVPLNDRGREQARELGLQLKAASLEAILASDLSRSRETAEIVAKEIGLGFMSIHSDPRIKEAYLGDVQGLTVPEIQARIGAELLGRWRSNHPSDADIAYPGGESGRRVLERVLAAVHDFASKHAKLERAGISTHGGVIRRLIHHIMRETCDNPPDSIPIPNTVVYPVTYLPELRRWRSEVLN